MMAEPDLPRRVLGLDIGGANLKAATADTRVAVSRGFEVWRAPHRLAPTLVDMVSAIAANPPPISLLAVTMTAELADCYATKAEGVAAVLGAVELANQAIGSPPVRVYLTDGTWASPVAARAVPLLAAASNWRAIATLAAETLAAETPTAQSLTGSHPPNGPTCGPPTPCGLLIDMGSTTTDVVPLVDGRVATDARTDTDRLTRGELVYTGLRRTPLCAVTPSLPWRGAMVPVAAELFATTADAYLSLGWLADNPADNATADGRPATTALARVRLARMICADATMLTADEITAMASHVVKSQRVQIVTAIRQVSASLPGPPTGAVVSGEGEWLACQALAEVWPAVTPWLLSARLGPSVSRVAPAWAVATLAGRTLTASETYG